MSDPKKTTPPAAPAPTTDTRKPPAPLPGVPPGIPVKIIRLERQMQVAGYPATDAVETKTAPDRRRWELEFIPAIRHHRITFYPASPSKPIVTEYLHETFVRSWIPLEPAPAAK